MKFITINLIGQEEEVIFAQAQNRADGAQSRFHSPQDNTSGAMVVPENTFTELSQIIEGSLPNAAPTRQKVNVKTQDPAYLQALRYAAPNLGNDDYYPEKSTNPIIGSASNKTLGTFPLFSSAALAPAGLWDKRRRAVADYMANLESSRAAAQGKLEFPEFTYAEGNPDWSGVVNQVTIDDLNQFTNEAQRQGYNLSEFKNVSTPYGKGILDIKRQQKTRMELVNSLQDISSKLDEKSLSGGTEMDAQARQSLSMWRYFSSLPFEEKEQLIRNPSFVDALSQAKNTLVAVPSLKSLVNERLTPIKEKAFQEYTSLGSNQDYDSFLIEKLESQYPLAGKKNPITGETEKSANTFIRDLAIQIARSRPEQFKDAELAPMKKGMVLPSGEPMINEEGIQESAPYTLDMLEDMIRDNMGYSYSKSVQTAGKDKGAGIEQNKIKAVPQYVEMLADAISRGRTHSTKTGKGEMIPGTNATTFIINGKRRVVLHSNTNEMARAIIELGGSDNEYGDVDAPSAWANIQSNKEVYKILSESTGAKRPQLPPSTASFQEKFNMATKEISGENGFPVAKGINATGIKSMSSTKDDSKFYMVAKVGGEEGLSSGTIIPKDILKAEVDEGDGLFEWGNVDVFVPKGGEADFLTGTYYVKNPSKDGKPSTYTLYYKETNTVAEFPKKTGGTFTITVPEYFVKKMTSQPYMELKSALDKYKPEEDNVEPGKTTSTVTKNVATQKGGSGSVITVQSKDGAKKEVEASDEDLGVAQVLINNPNSKVTDMATALDMAKQYREATDADTKDFYAKLLKAAGKVDVKKIRQQNTK